MRSSRDTTRKTNPLEPKRGMTISAYMSRRDIGSGTREFIVLSAHNKKKVKLFYPPLLKSFRLFRSEWDRLIVIVETMYADSARLRYAAALEERMAQYNRLHLRYNARDAELALSLLRGNL